MKTHTRELPHQTSNMFPSTALLILAGLAQMLVPTDARAIINPGGASLSINGVKMGGTQALGNKAQFRVTTGGREGVVRLLPLFIPAF